MRLALWMVLIGLNIYLAYVNHDSPFLVLSLIGMMISTVGLIDSLDEM